MLKNVLIGVLALFAIIVSIGARQGTSFTVERHVDIRASALQISPFLNDLRRARPTAPALLRQVVEQSETTFILAPNGAMTRLTWRVHGPLTTRTRLVTAMTGMDPLLGNELDRELARVKAAAEK